MNPIASIVVLIAVVVGAWYLFARNSPVEPAPITDTVATSSDSTTPTSSVPTIVYTDSGFSPATLTVPAGAAVIFANQSNENMMVAASPHPTHQDYDGTTRAAHCAPGYSGPEPFDQCTAAVPGASWMFTFTKAGTWKFHNHADPGYFGSVIVE